MGSGIILEHFSIIEDWFTHQHPTLQGTHAPWLRSRPRWFRSSIYDLIGSTLCFCPRNLSRTSFTPQNSLHLLGIGHLELYGVSASIRLDPFVEGFTANAAEQRQRRGVPPCGVRESVSAFRCSGRVVAFMGFSLGDIEGCSSMISRGKDLRLSQVLCFI